MRVIELSFLGALVLLSVLLQFTGSFTKAVATVPANDTITTKITDTLKSITANVSNSVQDNIDKVIFDAMDIMIENAMNKLDNTTILENNDAPTVKFGPNIPSGIDVSQPTPISQANR